jgi:hypothetical protein
MAEGAKTILTSFLRRLTNLSGNNRGLLLLRLSVDQFLDIHSFSYLNGLKSFEIIRTLVKGNSVKVCAVHDSRMEANNEASQKLKMLQRTDNFVFEERGTNDLHVGWPFVRGMFSDGTLVRCPLLYFPVKLVQQNQHWILEPRTDAGITFNKAFILAYAFYHNLKVEEDLLDFSFEDFDKDINVFRTQLYQLLQNKIELNFNTQNFQDELIPFVQYKRAEFEEQHKAGEIKLFPEAVVGIFPQSGSQLVPDYLHLIESEKFNGLESFFEGSIPSDDQVERVADEVFEPVKEEKLFTPFSLDAFQEKAIHLIKQGRSIVVQGPPGTGKSQLICNLLSDAIASGKKALLVCQKRAALDVVYDRMKSKDLSAFLGLVHDFRNDRKEIFEKISRQIERIEEYKERNRSADIIHMERKFIQICRTIDQTTEELQEFKDALYNERECGTAIKQLYLTSDLTSPAINLKQDYSYFTFPQDNFVRKLKRYSRYADIFNKPGYVWRDRKSFEHLEPSDEEKIEAAINDIISYQKIVSENIFRLTGATLNLEEAETLWFRHEEILGMLSLLKEEMPYRFFQKMSHETDDETSMLWLSNMERVVMNCFEEPGPEITIAVDKLGKFQGALNERMKTRGNLFRKLRWEFFSEDKFLIKRVLVLNDLAYNKHGLRVLEQRIDSRLNLEHHLTFLKNSSWLIEIPEDYNSESLSKWFHFQKHALKAKTFFSSLREIRSIVNPEVLSRNEFHALMRDLLDALKDIPSKKEEWQRWLSPFHIKQIIAEPACVEKLIKTLHHDFDNLCEYDNLKADLSTTEENVILKLYESNGSWDEEKLEALFENSIRLSWIDHIEVKDPILRSVSSMRMEEMQRDLQQLVAEKQRLSLEILLLRGRELAYEGLTYNRLNNLVTYRDLQHQVNKKKKLWPLRKLISTYHQELFQLIPCWLASPESVSALFPMEPLFDIVIFDEASQCFAERGIPAMYRGKQMMIAGDGQQLRPSELYQIRWANDESESPDEEVESLLELAERYLPTIHLQGHYRSKSLELIEFSNRNFYGHRLRLLPDRSSMNAVEPAIEYCKIDGVWENQSNLAEAKVVVEKVFQLFENFPTKEIGIVTFNSPQQNLILDLLEEESVKLNVTLPSSLFVKNIENVQGDEKDIIVFSVAYAPDKKGKMVAQFGSLSTSGGENRLNVAVTRARERVIIITSIFPEHLDTMDSKNRGPKLLREYLEFAMEVHSGKSKVGPLPLSKNNTGESLGGMLVQWGNSRLPDFHFEMNALPYADVNVLNDGKYLGVILTDDERFCKSISIKDAFAYTPALLDQKNWKYKYVYSRQFWKDQANIEESLMLYIGSQVS